MYLYELKKGAKLYEKMMAQIGNTWFESDVKDDPLIVDHVKDKYSVCYLESKPAMIAHLAASTPVQEYKDGWKIAPHTAADHKEVREDASLNRA